MPNYLAHLYLFFFLLRTYNFTYTLIFIFKNECDKIGCLLFSFLFMEKKGETYNIRLMVDKLCMTELNYIKIVVIHKYPDF